jgi:DNA repair photolyase
MTESLQRNTLRGRGAITNRGNRFESVQTIRTIDGWPGGDKEDPAPATVITEETCRSILTRNTSPDVPFDQSINPYRGCEHGCVYCFARPTHAFAGLSPGLDFETRLFAKTNAAEVLRAELGRKSYRVKPITLGANTDPYQPAERRYEITRSVLKVLAETNHPVSIVTKSNMIMRDLDILAPMAVQGLVHVAVSVTTLQPDLARRLEPRAPAPRLRLEAIKATSEAGIPTTVLAAPMIPFVNDHELDAILRDAAGAGAKAAGYILLRLPLEIKELFTEWLQAHVPDRAERVLARVRDCRGGALYTSEFGERMRGTGAYADLLADRFRLACRRYGFEKARLGIPALKTTLFRPPAKDTVQMSLF